MNTAYSPSQEGIRTQDLAFSQSRLTELAKLYGERYQTADPFPHVVIDDFMSASVLDTVLDEFPGAKEADWLTFGPAAPKKFAQKNEDEIGSFTRFLLYQFNSPAFITFLENLTGINGLIPDPHLWGGGLHQSKRDGFLKIHSDFTMHPVLNIDRRINVLIYLNRDWDESYGGHLELWDRAVTQCKAKILPVFNRCVIFNTTDFSFHGIPEPLTCPPDRTRKSIALYYYTNGRPADETKRTTATNWQMTPKERETGKVKRMLAKLVPPIIFDLKHAMSAAIKGKSD